jgi:hypothetical protein
MQKGQASSAFELMEFLQGGQVHNMAGSGTLRGSTIVYVVAIIQDMNQ